MAPFPWLLAAAGFDLGDWLIPLLLIGGAIANLISQRKAKTGRPAQPPVEEPPPWVVEESAPPQTATSSPTTPKVQDLDELMEALGIKEPRKPKPPAAAVPPRIFSPPPPVPSPVREALDIPREHPSMGDRTAWPEQAVKFVSRVAPPAPVMAPEPSAAPGKTPTPHVRPKLQTHSVLGHSRRDSLRRLLTHPSSVRQAILLSELLRPPVAYRP